ncbi:MAG: glutathione S-transferase [Gammaproteobacteria bacterium]|nr:MAG: glutathione S-transferase [Gammaproteobacteria bacterium]
MKLYGSLTSPYVRKCRVLLKEKALACEFVQADAGGPGSPVPALNPLGKVPVLERDDGSALFDSPVILEYLDSLKPPVLLAASGEERWLMLRWQALADGILDATVTRLLEKRRPVEQQSAEGIKRQEEKIARALTYAEQHAGGAYLMQDKFTAADVCLGVALEYVDFRYAHDWRAQHPKLARWLAGISVRASFTETVPPGMEKK